MTACNSASTLIDSQHGDSHAAGGRLQHRAAAQEPREEPLHGRPSPRPLPPLPDHHRRGKLQLHQRCAHGCKSQRQLKIFHILQKFNGIPLQSRLKELSSIIGILAY